SSDAGGCKLRTLLVGLGLVIEIAGKVDGHQVTDSDSFIARACLNITLGEGRLRRQRSSGVGFGAATASRQDHGASQGGDYLEHRVLHFSLAYSSNESGVRCSSLADR